MERILQAVEPLARARAGPLGAPLPAAATLRLWDHFQLLDELGDQPSVHGFGVPFSELQQSYRLARELIGRTPYEALRALVDEKPAHVLAALVDWRPGDVRRWADRQLTVGLAAAARAGDGDFLHALSRDARARPPMPQRPAAWWRGNEAWLALIEHALLEPRVLADDLASFWTAGEHSRRAHGRIAALPPLPRARLDEALALLLDRDGELQRMLLCDYGPTPADALVPSLVARARPRDMEFPNPGSVAAALAKLDVSGPPRLAALPAGARLCAAARARPSLLRALAASFEGEDAAPVLAFMAEPFPPRSAIPTVRGPALVGGLVDLALGGPGETVRHGLMPSRVTKLARLVLAAAGHWPAEELRRAARAAYAQPSYAAHDAVACLLVGSAPDEELARLAHRRGARLRRKWHDLLRWRGLPCPSAGCSLSRR